MFHVSSFNFVRQEVNGSFLIFEYIEFIENVGSHFSQAGENVIE